MANNETIEILNGDKIVVNINTFRHFINELINRKIKGKGLSTNDFTNEDKTKLNSVLTSESIISADKISGDLSNSKIKLNNIFTERYPGDTRVYGIIPGANVSGTLTNAIIEGSKVSGELTNATINANKIIDYDNLGRLVTGVIYGVRITGNIEYATIDGSHVIGLDTEINRIISNNSNIFSGVTIQGSQIQGSITNSSVTIGGSQIKGNIDVATIGGSQINGTISGSLISGELTKALIHADRIGDTIDGGYVLGVIEASRLRGNINYATIGGSQVSGKLAYATIGGSQVSGHLSNATIDASNVSGLANFIPTGGGDSTGIIDASRVSGDLVNANIDINRINKINDVIGNYRNGSIIHYYIKAEKVEGLLNANIIGSAVSGNLSNATIFGSRISDNINGTIISGVINANRIQGNLANAEIQGSNITGYIDVSKLQDTINNVVTVGKINAANISGGFLDNVLIPASTIHGELTDVTIKTVHIEGNILGSHIAGDIDASQISGNLTNATISAAKINDLDNAVSTYVDTIILADAFKLPANKIGSGTISLATIGGSQIIGKLTKATIDASNIEGTLTAESILADYSITSTHLATGAVLPENIASGNLQSGVKVNVNALVGNIAGSSISGSINATVISGQLDNAFLDANRLYETTSEGFVMGALKAGRLQGDINKERMRSGFLDLCQEYGVTFNNPGSGTD